MDQIVNWDYVINNVGTYVPINKTLVDINHRSRVFTFIVFGQLETRVYDRVLTDCNAITKPHPNWKDFLFKIECIEGMKSNESQCKCTIDELWKNGCQCGNVKRRS